MSLLVTGPEYKPQHMCYKCISKLLKFANFIDLSHKNDLKFDSLYQSCLEVSKREKLGKPINLSVKTHNSANGILESRGNEELLANKSQVNNPRRRRSSSLYGRKPFSILRKGVPKTNVKSRMKQQDNFSIKTIKNNRSKKKDEYTRYLNTSKKFLKIKPDSRSQNNKSPKIFKK